MDYWRRAYSRVSFARPEQGNRPERVGRPRTAAAVRVAIVASVLAIMAAGCGDNGDEEAPASQEESTKVAEAKKLVAEAQAPAEWKQPGPAFDASKVRGKRIFWLSLLGNNPYTEALFVPFKKAADALGIEVIFFDGKGQPSEFIRGLERAMALDVDAIVNQAATPGIVHPLFKEARKRGIKTIDFVTRDNAGEATTPGVTDGDVQNCQTCQGKLLADFAVADSNGNVNGVIVQSPELAPLYDPIVEAFNAELERLCPDNCSVEVADVALSQWQTKLPTLTPTLIRDPKVNYLFPLADAMSIYMLGAIHSSQAQDRVKIATLDGNVGPLKSLKDGDVIVSDLGTSIAWSGWAAADQVARLLAGEEPVVSHNIGTRMFTEDNIEEIDLDKPEFTWYGPADFEGNYLKLWGLK